MQPNENSGKLLNPLKGPRLKEIMQCNGLRLNRVFFRNDCLSFIRKNRHSCGCFQRNYNGWFIKTFWVR